MAERLFVVGFTIEEVRAIHAQAKQLLLEGPKTIMSWGDSGSSVSKQFALPVDKVLDECSYALRKLDPATYGRRRRVAVSQAGVIDK